MRHLVQVERVWPWLCAGVLAIQAVLLIFAGQDAGSWAWDQHRYHLLVIEQFTTDWPRIRIADYASATSPGWHLILTATKVYLGFELVGLRVLAMMAGMALSLSQYRVLARWLPSSMAAILSLPMVFSPYVVGGSAWITTDVPALLCVALGLASLLTGLPPGQTARWRPFVGVIWMAAGMMIRQNLIWLCMPWSWRALEERRFFAFALLVIPFSILFGLVWAWGGLTPPTFRDRHDQGINLASPVLFFALAGCWSLPFTIALWNRGRVKCHCPRFAMLIGVAVLILSLAVPTAYDVEAGRSGGPIWMVVKSTPAPLGRSVVLVALAGVGASCLTYLAAKANMNGRGAAATIILLALAGCVAVNTVNSQAWQRYADLPLMLTLPWLAALAWPSGESKVRLMVAAGTVALLQAIMALPMLWIPALG